MDTRPTLLKKGNLKSVINDPNDQKMLDAQIPIEYIMEWIKERTSKTGMANRVLILKSETASGKSTTLPPWIFRKFLKNTSLSIAVTQPRILTAIGNVKEILKHNSDLRLGKNIGWSTKYNKLRPDETAIMSMTVGTLTQQLKSMSDSEIMDKYQFILLDEIHERDLQTDLAISMLKGLLIRNESKINCPFIILMSATFDHQHYLDYFDLQLATNFIWATGQTAPITEEWDWNGGKVISSYITAAATVVEKICSENPDDPQNHADIIVFLPGRAEFEELAAELRKLNKKMTQKINILFLDSEIVNSGDIMYKLITEVPTYKHIITIDGKKYIPKRRCILSTNVAETGITLSDLKYVVDSGFNRETEYNPIYGTIALLTKPAPQSRIKQRRGRAGRRLPGVFYPLYPREIYEQLPKDQLPQLLVNNCNEFLLTVINEQLRIKSSNLTMITNKQIEFKLEDMDMVDPPTPDSLREGLELLYSIGLVSMNSQEYSHDLETMMKGPINKDAFGLTKLGAMAVQFHQIPLETIRMIQAGYFWKCSILDMITIATWLQFKQKDFLDKKYIAQRKSIDWIAIFKEGISKRMLDEKVIYKTKLIIADNFIYGLFIFNAIKNQVSNQTPREAMIRLHRWCDKNYVSYEMCIKFMTQREELIEQMITMGVEIFHNEHLSYAAVEPEDFSELIARLKYCIFDGYRNNMLTRIEEPNNVHKYYTKQGLLVKVPSMFADDTLSIYDKPDFGYTSEILPTQMLYSGLQIKYKRKTQTYEISVDKISALDGFIAVDKDFTI